MHRPPAPPEPPKNRTVRLGLGVEDLLIFVLSVALVLLVVFAVAAQADAQRLTATQSLAVEYAPKDGEWAAIGTLVLDLALAPRNHLTYIHDRAWEPGGWSQAHDMSVTRYFAGDISVSAGVRLKMPEDGPHRHVWYGVMAWPWGD